METEFKSPSSLFYNSISLTDNDGQHPPHLLLGLLERDVQVLVVLDYHLPDSDYFLVGKILCNDF